MRLSMWLFISLFYLQLPVYSLQIEPKVYITGTYTIQKIFQKIEQQTGKRIFYSNSILNDQEKIKIKVINKSIAEVLSQILSGKKLEWSIESKFITIVEIKNQPTLKPTLTQAQADTTITVSGRVTNEQGEPIAGATVLVKNSKNGTSTGIDGFFVIRKVRPDAYLTASSVQYMTKEIAIKGKTGMGDIQLEEYVGSLDETVIVAYSTTSKRLNTGDVSSVRAKDIQHQPVNNPLLALSGRVPGLTVVQSSGFAGSGITINIQGQNSIGKGNDPFYVVDGVPYTPQVLPTINEILGNSGKVYIGATQGSGNPFSYINPADIESIEILKDADATAIYGSRAANGAILITTKKGKTGQTTFDVTIQRGVGKVAGKMDLLNSDQYLEMRREAYKNDGLLYPTATTRKTASNYDITVWDTTRYTDWQKALLGGNANYTDVYTAVSGGNDQTTFRLTGGYHKETTIFPGNNNDVKISFGSSITHSSQNQKFKIQFSANYLADNNQLPGTDLTLIALQLAPTAPALYNNDGSLNWQRIASGADSVSTWTNPLSYLNTTYQNKTNNLITNTSFSYSIFKGLDFKTSLGYTNMTNKEIYTIPLSSRAPELRPIIGRYASYGDGEINSWIIEPQLNYKFHTGQGKINILLGTTFHERNDDLQQLFGQGYNSDEVLTNFRAAYTLTAGESIQAQYKYSALFGRINYNFNDKYIVNLTARRDGSSRYGKENRLHSFGAVGAAWIFSDENFIRSSLPFLSFGKLRSSYGTTGNDLIGDYQFLNQYEIIISGNPYQGYTGLQPNGHANPYLQWEETKKFQVGIDLGFLKDRILFNANYFLNRSSNQILSYTLPIISGFYNVFRNFPAKVQNSGWELSLNTINVRHKFFNWSSSINLTIPKNKLIEFNSLSTSNYSNSLIIGQPINISKLYSFAGVNPETGRYQYYTADKQTTSTPNSLKDRTSLYKPSPEFYGGLQNSISYKNFQLDFLFQFVKQMGRNYSRGFGNRVGLAGTNQPVTVLQRWQNPGDEAEIQKYSTSLLLGSVQASSISYTDASYIRLKNLSFSWSLPSGWNQMTHLQSSRLFIQGQNIITITKYQGLDPETRTNLNLPPLKVWTLGVQLTI